MQALDRARNFISGVDLALGRGSYSKGFWKSVMACHTWKPPSVVPRCETSSKIMECASTTGSSDRPGWGRVKVWVAAMQSYDGSSVRRGRRLVG